MLPTFQRLARPFAVLLLASTAPAAFAQAQTVPQARADASVPWLYRGSDIPVDREWTFGVLPNGVRYAVRRNGVPPRQVSVRVAIDAGSLNERPGEEGFAHFNEHLSFRGSKYVADGEAIRTWQRLGATFGSDTNASTTPTQTIYKLDLPAATPQGLDESIKILSGMMAAPTITAAGVETERRTVLAELREGSGAGQRVGDAARELFFAGQALGDHSPIGNTAALTAATPQSLRAFHDRWYRPDRTIVVIAGDADPATFEALITKHFSGWRGVGPSPADSDFGRPSATVPRVRVAVEPGVPLSLNMVIARPWVPKADTIEYNRGKLIDTLALRLISRRLETRARQGGSFLQASVDQDDVSRSVDATFVSVVPLGDDWEAAARDVRGVIADALATPPSQAEIDREANEFSSALQVSVEQAKTQNGGDLADSVIEAVNIRETVASPEVARDVFANMQDRLTPAAMLASTRRMFTGTPMRALLATPKPVPGAEARLLAVLTTAVAPSAARTSGSPVSFAQLPPLGPPATVTGREKVSNGGIEFAGLSNGVRVILYPNPGEQGRVYVNVRFGRGLQALPADRKTVAWAGSGALIASGIGPFDQDALDRLTSGRQIGLSFGTGDDAFQFRGVTRPADLFDQLRLIAAKLANPRWDAAPVVRMRAALEAGYPAAQTTPAGVLGRELPLLLHGGDLRWAQPSLADIRALTPQAFRATWEPLLASGPIEVSVFGDVGADVALDAIAKTIGALPPRAAAPVGSPATRGPAPSATPVVRTHAGPVDQAAAVLAWPTAGGPTEIYESRKLDILAQIYNDRLFDALRGAEGAAYSPNVSSNWPAAMPGGGSFTVVSQLNPSRTTEFFALARRIATDLIATPVSADELQRAVGPTRQQIDRASSGNSFWLGQLAGSTSDARRIEAIASLASDYARITPVELQATARRWLAPDKVFSMVVLPEKR